MKNTFIYIDICHELRYILTLFIIRKNARNKMGLEPPKKQQMKYKYKYYSRFKRYPCISSRKHRITKPYYSTIPHNNQQIIC